MNNEKPILIIGAGSIGERHIRNLSAAGFSNLSVYRQRNLPFRNIGHAVPKVITDWETVLEQQFYAAFICTPTAQHIDQAIACLQNNMHVFCEKPLSHTLDKTALLKETASAASVYFETGYMLHFHPFLMEIKTFVDNGEFGKLLSAETWWHSWLPDWHPWENYKEGYAAKKESGGGATLTLCHDIELLMWMCGSVKNHQTQFEHCTDLELEVNTGSTVSVEFESGVLAKHHISFCSRHEKRLYTFQFESASVFVDYLGKEMAILHQGRSDVHTLPEFDRNQMYADQLHAFFRKIESRSFNADAITASIQKDIDLIRICTEERSASINNDV